MKNLAYIATPTNVRIEAITNNSVVVQWDFIDKNNNNDNNIDGFIVKYIHEPNSLRDDNNQWKSLSVMDSFARHLYIDNLLSNKSYAFCVIAIKQNVSLFFIKYFLFAKVCTISDTTDCYLR